MRYLSWAIVLCVVCAGSVAAQDEIFSDDFDVIVEIRAYSSSYCGYWDLTVYGHTPVSTENCPRP